MLAFVLALGAMGCDTSAPGAADHRPEPDSGGTACAEGLVADGQVCVPEACGVGPWGDVGAEARWFVSPAGDIAPDGEETYSAINDALNAAEAEGGGGVIAVAAGTYVERLVVYDEAAGVRVVGRCAEKVTMDGSQGANGSPSVYIELPEGEAFGLAGMTVTGGFAAGVYVGGGTVSLADLVVDGNGAYGIQVRGASSVVTVANTEIRSTELSGGIEGIGLSLTNDAQMSFAGGSVHDNAGIGVSVLSAGRFEGSGLRIAQNGFANIGVQSGDATVSASTIEAPIPSEDAAGVAFGASVSGGGTLAIDDSVVDGSVGAGVFVWDEDSELTLNRSVVSGTSTAAAGAGGWGAAVTTGGRLEIRDSELRDNATAGAFASEEGSTLVIERSEIVGNGTGGGDSLGGVYVIEQAHGTLETTSALGNGGAAVHVAGGGSSVTIRECVLADTLPGSVDFGLHVGEGASAEVYNTEVSGVPGTAILVSESGSTLLMEDSTVTGGPGTGISIYGSAAGGITLNRVEIREGADFGVLLWDTKLVAQSLTVVGTATGEPSFNQFQYAIGVAAFGDSVATLKDAVVSETGGPGLFVSVGSSVGCTGCDLSRNVLAGAVSIGGELILQDSVVADNGVPGGYGFGVYVAGFSYISTITIEDTDFDGHAYAHVWVDGPHDVHLLGNRFGEALGLPLRNGSTLHGNSVFATENPSIEGAPRLVLEGNQLGPGGGPAVLLDGATATMDEDNVFEAGRTGVWQQRCEAVAPPQVLPQSIENSVCLDELQTDPQEFSLGIGDFAEIENG